MNRRKFIHQSLAWSLGLTPLLRGFPAVLAQPQKEKAEEGPMLFPEWGEMEFETSVIRIPLYRIEPRPPNPEEVQRLTKESGRVPALAPDEILELRAFMRMDRRTPVTNQLGYRQFEFTIRNWELFGYSALYDANVTFTASEADPGEPEIVQPRSICISLQRDERGKNPKYSDFPAIIHYNAIYDIYLDTKRIVRKQSGVATGTNVRKIPPTALPVAFQKPFWSPDINLGPGTCEDMQSITKEDFLAGRNTGIGLRRGDLDLRDDDKRRRREQLRPTLTK
jgi:hypothetical protein